MPVDLGQCGVPMLEQLEGLLAEAAVCTVLVLFSVLETESGILPVFVIDPGFQHVLYYLVLCACWYGVRFVASDAAAFQLTRNVEIVNTWFAAMP